MRERVDTWRPISTEPADGKSIWISDGERVWLGIAHKDGSLKLPSASLCKYWMTAETPAPPAANEQKAPDHPAF